MFRLTLIFIVFLQLGCQKNSFSPSQVPTSNESTTTTPSPATPTPATPTPATPTPATPTPATPLPPVTDIGIDVPVLFWPPSFASIYRPAMVTLIDDASGTSQNYGKYNGKYLTMQTISRFKMSADAHVVSLHSDVGLDGVPNTCSVRGDAFYKNFQNSSEKFVNMTRLPVDGNPRQECSAGTSAPDELTADGSFITFKTENALLPDDKNSGYDVYLADRKNRKIYLISKNESGVQNDSTGSGYISANGQYVALVSTGKKWFPNLVESENDFHIYLKELRTGLLFPISLADSGNRYYNVNYIGISPEGNKIFFRADLNKNDSSTRSVFVYSHSSRSIRKINLLHSVKSYTDFIVSQNAEKLAFQVDNHIYVQNVENEAGSLIDATCSGSNCASQLAFTPVGANGMSISGNGRFLIFQALDSPLLDVTDTNGKIDLFLKDLLTGQIHRILPNGVSVDSLCVEDGNSTDGIKVQLSYDGSVLLFESRANILGDFNIPQNPSSCSLRNNHLYLIDISK